MNLAIIKVNMRIMASKVNRAISKWFRCIDKVRRANNTEKGVKNIKECDIVSRIVTPISGLQDQSFFLAFETQKAVLADH